MPSPKAIVRLLKALTAEEAAGLASRGAHLRERVGFGPGGRAPGQLVGAPVGMTTADLPALRARLDEAVQRGAYARNWYEQMREQNERLSGGDPRLARELTAAQAVYSAKQSPERALQLAVGDILRASLGGPERAVAEPVGSAQQARMMARLRAGAPLREAVRGPKTGPYAEASEPGGSPVAELPRSVNDRRIGRIFGYPDRGFAPAEHAFMTGEMHLALQRAKETGVLPPDAGVLHAQAAAWAGEALQRLEKPSTVGRRLVFTPERPETTAAREAEAAAWPAWLARTAEAHETYEKVPGARTGSLTGATSLPPEQRVGLTRTLEGASPGQDPYYAALGVPRQPTTVGLGQFEGPLDVEYNPNRTAHPLVSYEGAGLAPEPEEMLRGVNAVRSAVDVQHAGAYHVVRPTAPEKANSVRLRWDVPRTDRETEGLYSLAAENGLVLIDTGDGTFTVATPEFGEGTPEAFHSAYRQFQGAANRLKVPRPTYQTPGRFLGEYHELPPYGEGRVTEDMLRRVSGRLGEKLDTPELRAEWARQNTAERAASEQFRLGPPREDVQRLRDILSREGVEGLRRWVGRHGLEGLPAMVPPLAGPAAVGPQRRPYEDEGGE